MRDEHSAAAAGLSDGRTTRRKLARSRQLAETLRRELAAAGGAESGGRQAAAGGAPLRRELAAAGGAPARRSEHRAPSARGARLAWMPSYHYWSHLG